MEVLEFSIRGCLLSGELLETSEVQFNRLKSLSSVLFHQAISPRWTPELLKVLKRARMVRTCPLMFRGDKELFRPEKWCVACESVERMCTRGIEIVGYGAGASVSGCNLSDVSILFDRQDDDDCVIFASGMNSAEYCGVYMSGNRCSDLVTAAVVANNLIGDTCYDIKRELDGALKDEAVVAQLERDEHATDQRIFALTDHLAVSKRLVLRIKAVEATLRGCAFPGGLLKHTGSNVVWKRLDGRLRQEFQDFESAARFSGERARSLLGGAVDDEQSDEEECTSSEGAAAQKEIHRTAALPLAEEGHVSSRTRLKFR